MRPLRDFHSKIQPYLTGCPEPTLNVALVDAAIYFCEQSRVIHQKTDPVPTFVGTNLIELDAPADQRVCGVRAVWVDGQKVNPVLAENVPGPNTATGKPTWYWGRRNDSLFEVALYPTPDGEYPVVADAIYCPIRDAQNLENDLYELWIDAIKVGTLARLYSIPGQPFSDMNMAVAASASFARYTADARRAGDNTRIIGSHGVRPRRFA